MLVLNKPLACPRAGGVWEHPKTFSKTTGFFGPFFEAAVEVTEAAEREAAVEVTEAAEREAAVEVTEAAEREAAVEVTEA